MKQKFFVYLLILFLVNNTQNMNIISPLHNLEKKLIQLKPFLAKQEPQKIEFKFPDIPVPQALTKLESQVDVIKENAQNAEQNLKDLLSRTSLKSKDTNFKAFEKNFKKIEDNVINLFGTLIVIGNQFKKGFLEQDQKTKLSSVLNKLTNIFEPFNKINLDPLIKPELGGREDSEIKKLLEFAPDISDFKILWLSIINTVIKIQDIIQNDTNISGYIIKDSKEIEELEKQIREKYDEALKFLEQIKKSSSPENKSALQKALEDLEQIPYDTTLLITTTIAYASFIKDNNLINILLTALKNQNLKLSQKLTQEASKLESLYPMKKIMQYTIESLENLENVIQWAESVLK